VFRLFLVIQLFFANIFACQGCYTSCVKKIRDSKTIQKKSLFIPVKHHNILVYSPERPKSKILKEDPFLSLYLIKDYRKFPYPFEVNMRSKTASAVVNEKRAKKGKIIKNQVGLNTLGVYTAKLSSPALITTSCCFLEAIVTNRGVIQKEYIQRFLSHAPVTYGDIGIRVKNKKGLVVVSASDPYIKENPFKKGDCIVAFDGREVHAASVFMRAVLFSKIGSLHSVKIKRHGELLHVKVITHKRYGGGAFSDTFLEQKGIYFDKKLHIVKLSKQFKNYGLLLGDELLQVNGKTVKNEEELREYVEGFKDFSLLLFERRNFQFFVKIK